MIFKGYLGEYLNKTRSIVYLIIILTTCRLDTTTFIRNGTFESASVLLVIKANTFGIIKTMIDLELHKLGLYGGRMNSFAVEEFLYIFSDFHVL